MQLTDFAYDLPDDLIARFPPLQRRDSRLLVVGASLDDRQFADLPTLLLPGDLLILNDTRVIRARLAGKKQTGGKIEVLVERILDDRHVLAQIRASKSPKPGTIIELAGGYRATVTGRERGLFHLALPVSVPAYLARYGAVPLPPYIDRQPDPADDERYQTVYAREPGAVAAPTAGLHFDETMLGELAACGVQHAFVTLHVGAGTFQPLREDQVKANKLHAERMHLSGATCQAIAEARARGGRIVAVGTTTVRVLETASAGGNLEPFDGETEIFIVPGYRFHVVDALLTNFHLPCSSLMMLVAAFAGRERILDAYRHAVDNRYRFFSYGDTSLIFPEE